MRRVIIPDVPMSIMDLYECTAIALGCKDIGSCKYDCTSIRVAENIFANVEKHYAQRWGEHDYKLAFGMEWCCCGPKVDKDLPDSTAEVDDDFIVEASEL